MTTVRLSPGRRYNASMLQRFGPHAANVLTALRIVLTPLFISLVWAADGDPGLGRLAVACFATIAASDVYDGRLARRWGSVSNSGRTFDHLADIGFILTALSAYAVMGITPWWVPAAIGGSFGFYVVDSWSRVPIGAPNLVGSRIGHVAGISNYVLVGVLVCNNSAGVHLLSAAVLDKLFWLVPMYSAAAVVSRVATRLTAHRRAVPLAASSA